MVILLFYGDVDSLFLKFEYLVVIFIVLRIINIRKGGLFYL